MPSTLTRRRLVGGLLALGAGAAAAPVLAGCSGGSSDLAPAPGPAEVARRSAAATEAELERLARTTAAAHPSLAPVARTAAQAHAAHAAALLDGLPAASATPGPTASPSPSPSVRVPAEASTAAAALARAEDAAAAEHLATLADVGGTTARLLASVGASDAAHAAILRQVRR